MFPSPGTTVKISDNPYFFLTKNGKKSAENTFLALNQLSRKMRSLRKFVQYSYADILGDFPCNKTTTMAAHSRLSLLKNAVYSAEENNFLFYILAGNYSFSVQNGIR